MFSIFTQSAGRLRLSPVGSGCPVSGATGGGGAVGAGLVVVAATVVVLVAAVVDGTVLVVATVGRALLVALLHAASRHAVTTTPEMRA